MRNDGTRIRERSEAEDHHQSSLQAESTFERPGGNGTPRFLGLERLSSTDGEISGHVYEALGSLFRTTASGARSACRYRQFGYAHETMGRGGPQRVRPRKDHVWL